MGGKRAPRTPADLLKRINAKGYSYPEIAQMLGGGDPSYLRAVVAGKKGKGGGQKHAAELTRIYNEVKFQRTRRRDVEELAPQGTWTRTRFADVAKVDGPTAQAGMLGFTGNIRGRAKKRWLAAFDCVFKVAPDFQPGPARVNKGAGYRGRVPISAAGSPASRWSVTWSGEAGDIVRMLPRGKDLTDTLLRLLEDRDLLTGNRSEARKQLFSVEIRLWEQRA